MTKHPVHIVDEDGNRSPSAFIPFCSFGEDMTSMGKETDGFNIPVCNSFKAKVKSDQLCYEIDLQKFKNKKNIQDQLKSGLVLILDYNEDRQWIMKKQVLKKVGKKKIFSSNDENSVQIHLDTISIPLIRKFFSSISFFRSCFSLWRRAIQPQLP